MSRGNDEILSRVFKFPLRLSFILSYVPPSFNRILKECKNNVTFVVRPKEDGGVAGRGCRREGETSGFELKALTWGSVDLAHS